MPDPSRSPDFTEKQLAAIAMRERGETNQVIMTTLKMSGTALSAGFRKAGLPLRTPHDRRPLGRRRPPGRLPPAKAGGAAAEPLGRRLERLLAARIADLEGRAGAAGLADPETIAKALALHVRTLATLRRVGAGPDDDAHAADTAEPEAPPRSLSQLRDELRGHLRRLHDEAKARRSAARARSDPG